MAISPSPLAESDQGLASRRHAARELLALESHGLRIDLPVIRRLHDLFMREIFMRKIFPVAVSLLLLLLIALHPLVLLNLLGITLARIAQLAMRKAGQGGGVLSGLNCGQRGFALLQHRGWQTDKA
jgi:hypothetical protein